MKNINHIVKTIPTSSKDYNMTPSQAVAKARRELKKITNSDTIWSSFLLTVSDEIKINSYTIENYNDELFESILILFNEYLLKKNIKNYRKYMNDIEEFYNSLCVLPYKFYFYKDEMWKLNNLHRNKNK